MIQKMYSWVLHFRKERMAQNEACVYDCKQKINWKSPHPIAQLRTTGKGMKPNATWLSRVHFKYEKHTGAAKQVLQVAHQGDIPG